MKKVGVYVWGFQNLDGVYFPYYVGKHRANIYSRIQQHLKGIQTDTHRILRKELLFKRELYSSDDKTVWAFRNLPATNTR